MDERLKKIIEERTESNIEITEDTVLLTDLGMSSFDLVQLACAVEDEFDIEIDAKYVIAENFANKEAIIALVKKIADE